MKIISNLPDTTGATGPRPDGAIKDVSAPGAGDGTPVREDWLNDVYYALLATMEDGGVSADDSDEEFAAGVGSQFLTALLAITRREGSDIGSLAIQLTNYTGVGKPAIAAGGRVEIDGVIYRNDIEVAIGGATANTTWFDILLTPSGTTFTASFIARGTGVWSDSKQGLYDGNNRVIGIARRNTSDADWINKNVLIVHNRTVKIKIEIGDWDMDATDNVTVAHGLSTIDNVILVQATIINDVGSFIQTSVFAGLTAGDIDIQVTVNATIVNLQRLSGGFFDNNTNYDSTSFNRGRITLEYEV